MTERKKVANPFIDSLLKSKGISVWGETDKAISEELLKRKVRQVIETSPQLDPVFIIDEDFDKSEELLVEKTNDRKIKGDLLIVYSKFSASSDVADIVNYEEKLRYDFLMYDRFFKIHFYNIFLKEDIEDFLIGLKKKPFLVFFLKNNSFSDIEDLIDLFANYNGFLYSEKKFESEKIEFFEYGRRAFLVTEKQGKF